MKLVFATNNQNKLKEVQEMLPESIELLSPKDIGCFEDIEETATTLEGNAQIKANHITNNYNFNCFADDTGLEVDALNGEPGVYSARYAGEPANAENNMQKLLSSLGETVDRKAHFRTSICLNLDGKQFLFDGICKGEILTEKKGEKGFGYDPVFQPEGYNKSFAEMSSEAKNEISHRGLAIQKLIDFLKTYQPNN
ncbi:non-canonical purine NTP diphosphatase [Tenacibaculum sp. 190524A05c]|uniref:dITP/XTP pyrophosphatase n=1 Tax=Tenacibaculum platacis TaxID=3137852 RepID=A0ABP1EQQ9_9FLAO